MMSPSNNRVAVLAYDGLCTFEFGIAIEIFGQDRPELAMELYELDIVAVSPGPLRAMGGIQVLVDKGLEEMADVGTIVIPGWKGEAPPGLLAALRSAHDRGARIITMCSGAYLLAETGLLDGKEATTHWRSLADFSRVYPRVKIRRDVLFIDENSVATSAGSASAIDLCLHVVRSDYGAEIANQVARRLVVSAQRDGGQAQFVEAEVPKEVARLGSTLEWAQANLDQQMTVDSLAAHSNMSPRTFARHFVAEMGMTPHRWLVQQRLSYAQRLLESSQQSVDRVALSSGFGSAATLRHHFRRAFGTTPTAHRRRFAV